MLVVEEAQESGASEYGWKKTPFFYKKILPVTAYT